MTDRVLVWSPRRRRYTWRRLDGELVRVLVVSRFQAHPPQIPRVRRVTLVDLVEALDDATARRAAPEAPQGPTPRATASPIPVIDKAA